MSFQKFKAETLYIVSGATTVDGNTISRYRDDDDFQFDRHKDHVPSVDKWQVMKRRW